MKLTPEFLEKIISKLPDSGETKFPAMTYEHGIEEVLSYLLDEIDSEDFHYSI